ncbi:MAG: hypothetical protein Q8L34_01310 [Candidatus Woesearchaeota archaeon]|nr:hypothetical protein [Candidatus Woesearchaeota archaeon]
MTDTKTLQNYQLQGNPAIPVPILGNMIYDQALGEEAVARLNEAFRGVQGIEDKTQYGKGNPVAKSNTLRNLFYHSFLRELSDHLHIQSPIEMVRHWNALLERDTTYADSNAISVFPNPGPNEELRMAVLRAFGKTATTVPLLVMGLKPVKSDTSLGVALKRTDSTEVREAPYLAKSGRVKYDPATHDLVAAKDDEEGVQIWVPEDQSGLRRACRGMGVNLNCGDVGLLSSFVGGRAPMIQVPKGRAEDLDKLLQNFREEDLRLIQKMSARREKALQFYRTGQF